MAAPCLAAAGRPRLGLRLPRTASCSLLGPPAFPIVCRSRCTALPGLFQPGPTTVMQSPYALRGQMQPTSRRGIQASASSSATGDSGSSSLDSDQKVTPVLLVSVTATLIGSFLIGYHLGVLNTSMSAIGTTLSFSVETVGALLASIPLIGAIIGAGSASSLSKTLGPQLAIGVSCIPFLIGAGVCGAAATVQSLLIGRFICGLGIGFISVLTPGYLSDISPKKIRGLIGSFNQILICTGILASYLVGLPFDSGMLSAVQSELLWRKMFWISTAPAVFHILFFVLAAPQSPSYLVARANVPEATRISKMLWGPKAALPPPPINESSAGSGLLQTLTAPSLRRVVVLAVAVALLQQLSGINTVIFYSSQILALAGMSRPVIGSCLIGAINIVVTVISAVLVDSAGRKSLLTASFAGMTLFLFALSVGLCLPLPEATTGTIALVAIFAYIAAFAIGCGSIPWLYVAEIVPPQARAQVQGAATAANWASNFIIGLTFPPMTAALGLSGSYAIYTLICAAGTIYLSKAMVETANKSPQEIEAMLIK